MIRDKRSDKRTQFTRPAGRNRLAVALVLLFAAFAIAVTVAFITHTSQQNPTLGEGAKDLPAAPVVKAMGDVRVPVATLAGGEARFFDYQPAGGGQPVRLFALRDNDGTYRAALDACVVCYHAKKGYAQQDGKLVCRKCGNVYAPAAIDDASGACHPIGLPRQVEGEHLVIKGLDVEQAEARLATRAASRN